MAVLTAIRPNWRELLIHESSPGARGASLRLQDQCPGYVATQYDTSIPFGSVDEKSNHRSEDLAAQTFPDGVFDVVVTQDVFEHLFDPAAAISEIRRTLKPNGIRIMTVPIMRGEKPTIRRALMCDGVVRHLELPPLYHGNPISQEGSLVTIDWGNDIAAYLSACSGLVVTMHCIDDMTRGIRGIYNDVLVGRKTESLPVL